MWGKSMHSCGFYGMVIFFYWKSFWLVLLWPLHSFVFSSNRSESKEMIKDDQGWPWSLWACIGSKIALHWWPSRLALLDWFVFHSTIRVNQKYKRLPWTRVGSVVIRSDPGVFEFALVTKLLYIGGKVVLKRQSSLEMAKLPRNGQVALKWQSCLEMAK